MKLITVLARMHNSHATLHNLRPETAAAWTQYLATEWVIEVLRQRDQTSRDALQARSVHHDGA